jgi:hypothetical protein
LGSWDLTDGQWVWPEGLAHCVEKHWVCLPDEFADTMRSNSWQVPPLEELAMAQARGLPYDLSFWVAWSGRRKKRPWWVMIW